MVQLIAEEQIMSDGGAVGNGIQFWATIRIAGNLKQPDLKKIMDDIRDVLNRPNVNGDVVHGVRVRDKYKPVLSIEMPKSATFIKKKPED